MSPPTAADAGQLEAPPAGAASAPNLALEQLSAMVSSNSRLTVAEKAALAVFDFSVAADREQAYQLVLLKAGTVSDLKQWLDGRELVRLWPDLYLPRVVRAAWQDRHAALARVGAGPHVPQL